MSRAGAARKKLEEQVEKVLDSTPTSVSEVLALPPVEAEKVSGQARLIASLRALRYVKSLGGDRAQVIMARRLMREGLARCIHVPLELALDEGVEPADRLRAVELLAKYGLGTTVDRAPVGPDHDRPGVLLLPTLEAIEEAAAKAARAADEADARALEEFIDHGDVGDVPPDADSIPT